MIVAEEGDGLVLVTQNDHAALAADLLGCWPALAKLSSRALLLEATRRHDNGWRETDSAPRIDSRGRPRDFLALPSRERRRVWERGMDRYRETHPACALLIVEHAIWLHREPSGDPELESLLAGAKTRRDALLAAVEGGARLVGELYPWLRRADDLSLRACRAREGPFELDSPEADGYLRGRVATEGASHSTMWTLRLEPFPLAGATTFPVRCRRIPRRRYESDSDLACELAEARWIDRPLRLEPDSG